MKRLLVVLLLVTASGPARAWSVGMIEDDKAEMGRITCGLLENYGPSRSYHDLSIAIPDSPYGPLTATMGPSRKMEIGVSMKRYAAQPAEAVRTEIRRWVVTHHWEAWRGEALWMTAYFSVAVWASIGLAHAPAWVRAGFRERRCGCGPSSG